MMHRMKLSRSLRKLRHGVEDTLDYAAEESRIVLRNVGLVSAGITVLAVGVVVGRELRQRYKFNRRTPYDFYSHSGENGRRGPQDLEFGVGI
jgi:hypothetical protein